MSDQLPVEPTDNAQPDVPEVPEKKLPRVIYGSAVIEKGKGKYPGSIMLPTYSYRELIHILGVLNAQIESAQEERLVKVKEGSEDFYPWELPEEEPGKRRVVYVNEEEFSILVYAKTTISSYTPDRSNKDFLDEDTIENLPKVVTESGTSPIAIITPATDSIADPVRRVLNRTGVSVSRNVPLWMSGFRVEIEGPSALAQLNLDTKLSVEKIDISRDTFGYALSAENIYMDKVLIDFILKNVISSTSGDTTYKHLLDNIALPDYDALVLGMASTLFPEGYTIERKILREIQGKISSVDVTNKINIWRTLGVKSSWFTQEEKLRLAKTRGSTPVDVLLKHRTDVRKGVSRFLDIGNGLMLKLWVPTLGDYLRIGMAWQSTLDTQRQEALESNDSEQERKIYIARASQVARVMFLSHWVEGVYESPTENSPDPKPCEGLCRRAVKDGSALALVDERISSILSDVAVTPDMCDVIIDGISDFISKMRASLMIIPRDSNAAVKEGEHPRVIVGNPVDTFFTLLRHKILMAGG